MNAGERIRALARARNRELAVEALIEAALGVLFTLLTFGFVFVLGLSAGWLVGRRVGLSAVGFAWIVTGVFFVTAVISAWRRVDPLAGVDPMTFEQEVLTALSQTSAQMLYFSPRHASAGVAMVLLGGPSNLFSAIGTWRHRLNDDDAIVHVAAEVLRASAAELDLERVRTPHAALLLRRLALIKVTHREGRPVVVATEKGREILA